MTQHTQKLLPGSTALIIGASMAGLMAARALSNHVERVIVIERDDLPTAPEFRKGVPQGRHIHALLAQGQAILDEYFPGFSQELTDSGSPRMTWCRDTCYYTPGGWIKRFDSGIQTNVITRPDLEWRVRRRLEAFGNITFMTGREVRHLVANADNSRVIGVEVDVRGENRTETMVADLVVDASGRGSKAPEWLTALGYDAPPETNVNSYVGYATRVYEKPAGLHEDWRVLFINGRPDEDIKRGAGVFDIGDGKWMVSLGGMNHEYPPTDDAGFLAYARTMASTTVYDAIKDATPITSIASYRIKGSQLRHFEKMKRRPDGFVAMGDSVCAFNPLYGQGMTVAAMEAKTLDQMLTRQGVGKPGFATGFQKRLARVVNDAWLVATGEDLRYPGTEGDRPNAIMRMTQQYVLLYLKLCVDDEVLTRAFIGVTNLTASPTTLFAPHLFLRVIGRALLQRFGGKEYQPVQSGAMIPAIST